MEQHDEVIHHNNIVNTCEFAPFEGMSKDNQDDEDCLYGIDVGVDFRHRGAAMDGRDRNEGKWRPYTADDGKGEETKKIHPAFWGGVDYDGEREYLMRL